MNRVRLHISAAVILVSFCVMPIKGSPLHACINGVYFHSCIPGITCYSYCVVWTDKSRGWDSVWTSSIGSFWVYRPCNHTDTHIYKPCHKLSEESCIKPQHQPPNRKPPHHPRQLVHPGLIYITFALVAFCQAGIQLGSLPKGRGAFKKTARCDP